LKRRRILVVDDEPDVTLTLRTVLEDRGYAVDAFNDPILAPENFKKAARIRSSTSHVMYDLVLTDIRMPTMTGFELYRKIRGIDSNVKVRFLTASEINYDVFEKKVAPTIDTESCFVIKPICPFYF
jgi:two-component system response regulator CpxR